MTNPRDREPGPCSRNQRSARRDVGHSGLSLFRGLIINNTQNKHSNNVGGDGLIRDIPEESGTKVSAGDGNDINRPKDKRVVIKTQAFDLEISHK